MIFRRFRSGDYHRESMAIALLRDACRYFSPPASPRSYQDAARGNAAIILASGQRAIEIEDIALFHA